MSSDIRHSPASPSSTTAEEGTEAHLSVAKQEVKGTQWGQLGKMRPGLGVSGAHILRDLLVMASGGLRLLKVCPLS